MFRGWMPSGVLCGCVNLLFDRLLAAGFVSPPIPLTPFHLAGRSPVADWASSRCPDARRCIWSRSAQPPPGWKGGALILLLISDKGNIGRRYDGAWLGKVSGHEFRAPEAPCVLLIFAIAKNIAKGSFPISHAVWVQLWLGRRSALATYAGLAQPPFQGGVG